MPSEKSIDKKNKTSKTERELLEHTPLLLENSDSNAQGLPDAEQNNDTDPESECKVQFNPVVSLDLVETYTGQENETSLLDMKCKLYRFDSSSKEWKERGLGKVIILEHKEKKKARLIMREEKTLKIRANHTILPGTSLLNKGNDKSWIWSAMDFAEGSQKSEIFCVLFGSHAKANEFKKVFDYACEINSDTLVADNPLDKLMINAGG